MIGSTGIEGIVIGRSNRAQAATDMDGFPAVKVVDTVWAEEPDQWIATFDHSNDHEDRVRELAAALLVMAGQMAAMRKAARA